MIEINLQKYLWTASGELSLSLDVSIKEEEIIALYGPSGAGKTTILRLISGLDTPNHGTIKVNNTKWLDTAKKINLAPQKREVGLVFQDFALFPNMTVQENLKFALPKHHSKQLILDIIRITELEKLKDRKPHQLSGGQKQRVALA